MITNIAIFVNKKITKIFMQLLVLFYRELLKFYLDLVAFP